MRYLKLFFGLFLVLPFFYACNDTLEINAQWKDITVVYGLLNKNDDVHYLKITKAYLGEGDALMFAKIPDSSTYPNPLNVTIEAWKMIKDGNGKVVDSQYVKTISFDTTIISNKEKGDDVFYYPYQQIYKSIGINKLDSSLTYKLFIKNPATGKDVTSRTTLVNKFVDITQPKGHPQQARFRLGEKKQVIFTSVKGGKRYQLVARFFYIETKKSDTAVKFGKYVDWVIFNDLKSENANGGEELSMSYLSDAFYSVVGTGVRRNIDPAIIDDFTRAANKMQYIFSVAADDMNTYMEVTEPSTTIVQEKPPYTNIINGIGLFSSRYDNSKFDTIVQKRWDPNTLQELRVNPNTRDLGF